jgi:hypothetical protein
MPNQPEPLPGMPTDHRPGPQAASGATTSTRTSSGPHGSAPHCLHNQQHPGRQPRPASPAPTVSSYRLVTHKAVHWGQDTKTAWAALGLEPGRGLRSRSAHAAEDVLAARR